MVITDSTIAEPAVVSYGKARGRRRKPGLARRFWTLEEVAERIGTTYNSLLMQVHRGRLPVVVIPTSLDRLPHRRRLAVPDVWLDGGRWFAMSRHEPGDAAVYTARTALRRPGDARVVSVEAAATACSISQRHAYMLVRADRFCRVDTVPGRRGNAVVVDDLDAWVYDLIHDAEVRWYEGISRRAVAS